ncbi:uncharacterized protein ARMOST_21437 [Armillaria ostoyae]|uniref:Uncharacterized protein n=1 Tax=Armillaria ostoyae TaxID=47428 RepID=A0A284SA38_ARMOS|nr:uncharacterized protein ARMOST_21437 [Armillaria ostoyae]
MLSKAKRSVPLPNYKVRDPGFPDNPKDTRGHGEDVLLDMAVKEATRRAKFYVQNVQTFKLSVSYEELEEDTRSLTDLELLCDNLQQKAPIPMSTRIVDKNGLPLLNILASRRHNTLLNKPPVLPIDEIFDEFHSQTALDQAKAEGAKIFHDGFSDEVIEHYHKSVQTLAHFMPPVPEKTQSRHRNLPDAYLNDGQTEIVNTENETFAVRDGYAYKRTEEGPPGKKVINYVLNAMEIFQEDKNGNRVRRFELCGVRHPVQAWIQQAKPQQGLYVGSDLTQSGETLVGYASYLKDTKHVSVIFATYFKILYPREYKLLKKVFDAGQWLMDEGTPFLGRAIVYKLPLKLHKDTKDFSITGTFPSGSYEGGGIIYPQLDAIFRYAPGDICFSIAVTLYHKLAAWTPTIMNLHDPTTPGRVGTVFFCPAETVKQLEGKKPGEGVLTHYGRNSYKDGSLPRKRAVDGEPELGEYKKKAKKNRRSRSRKNKN